MAYHDHMNIMDAAPYYDKMDGMDHTTDEPMQHMGMKMYFHVGYDETILFKWWKIDSFWELVWSMLGIFVLAFLYEALKYSREFLFNRSVRCPQYNSTSKSNIVVTDGQQPIQYLEQVIIPPTMRMLSLAHLTQTLLHMVQFLVSYFLMLIFMTYNTWLCLACLLGAATGYFVFGWRKAVVVDITEHCH